MKAVLDTNVLISGVITTGVPYELLVAGFEGEYQIVVSVETVRYFAEFVGPTEDIGAVDPDPDDDKFLEAAVAGDVTCLVSGDQHLLDPESFRGVCLRA